MIASLLHVISLFCKIASIVAALSGKWDFAAYAAIWALICRYDADHHEE